MSQLDRSELTLQPLTLSVVETPSADRAPAADVALRAGPSSVLRVLTYHRIGTEAMSPELSPATLSASPAAFERQVRMFARRFHVVDIADVVAHLSRGRPLPRNALLITFDDACPCFAEHAWPVLRRYGLPALLFVPTAFPGSTSEFWWDTVHRLVRASSVRGCLETPFGRVSTQNAQEQRAARACLARWIESTPDQETSAWLNAERGRLALAERSSPVLTWNELRGLAREGVALAAHSRTHRPLTCIPPEQLAEEVQGSLDDLRRETGSALPVFSYPGGLANEQILQHMRQAGVELAVVTQRGANRLGAMDPLLLRRINVGQRSGPAKLWLQLAFPSRLLNVLSDLLGR